MAAFSIPTACGRWRCSMPRVLDFSLQRLKHYSGTPFEHVQRYILFTNYHRYVDHFVAMVDRTAEAAGPIQEAVGAGRHHR